MRLTAKPSKPTNRSSGASHSDARTADEILALGEGERPTAHELAAWVSSAECPAEAFIAACGRLTALLGQQVQPPLELHDDMIVTEQVAISHQRSLGRVPRCSRLRPTC